MKTYSQITSSSSVFLQPIFLILYVIKAKHTLYYFKYTFIRIYLNFYVKDLSQFENWWR